MAFGVSKKQTEEREDFGTGRSAELPSQSYLGKTLQITGDITSDEILIIEGNIKGNITISKTLHIGKNGFVNGQINADVVKIEGKAEGNIKAVSKLHIASNGVFSGTMQSGKLVIEEGAVFQGKANLDN